MKRLQFMCLALMVLSFMSSCKKDDEAPGSGTNTFVVEEGEMGGKVTGNTKDDSTAFSFNYLFSKQYATTDSYWQDNGSNTVNINVDRYDKKDGAWTDLVYINISNWNPSETLNTTTADFTIGIETTQGLGGGETFDYTNRAETGSAPDKTDFHYATFNKTTGKFTFKVTVDFEDANAGTNAYNSTDNPGTFTLEFSGTLNEKASNF